MAPLDLGSAAVLEALNTTLLAQPYVSGFQASSDDYAVFAGMPECPSTVLPNLRRWHLHINALLLKSFPGVAAANTVPADDAALDAHFARLSYVTLFQPSLDDFTVYVATPLPPSRATPNAARWYRHITAILHQRFPGDARGVTVRTAVAAVGGA
mmetsp:Transcript_26664/g.66801  ORF Transcript_26664/g.66801 Transcript_26664/m.66801 type:complete len:155 (-) Transcript_26664:393-857(-)